MFKLEVKGHRSPSVLSALKTHKLNQPSRRKTDPI